MECEHLSHVPVDPEPGKQRHGEVHHFLGLGNADGSSFETPKPMALATMISRNRIRVGFAHDQSLRWDHRGIHLPMIGAVEYHSPSGQAINELLQGCGITTPTLPIKEVACIRIKSLPDPEFMPFF
jgi:hypothetical protein